MESGAANNKGKDECAKRIPHRYAYIRFYCRQERSGRVLDTKPMEDAGVPRFVDDHILLNV
jgi:hypothetical protein